MSFYVELNNAILDAIYGGQSLTIPSTLYVGLATAEPDGTNFYEPTGGDYARVAVTNDLTNWPAASSGIKRNGTSIQFPTASGTWGYMTHFFVADAATIEGGNLLGFGSLSNPKNVVSGDDPLFEANELEIRQL